MSDDSVAQSPKEKILKACQESSEYPQNILQTHKSLHVLERYHELLDEGKIFGRKRHITLLEYGNSTKDCQREICIENSGIDELRKWMNVEIPDPDSRYIFIPTVTSRSPLSCSQEQLTYLLSFLQVMPSALDIFLELRTRGNAINNTLFRRENLLGERNRSFAIPQLGRSGCRLQHAFNILGFENEKRKEEYSWPLRNISVYHSFDIGSGTSLWIISKANTLIQERVKSMTARYQQCYPEEAKSPEGALAASLRVHALILEYCTENLGGYIASLEHRAKGYSGKVKNAPVTKLVVDAIPETQEPEIDMGIRSRVNTGTSRISMQTRRAQSFPLIRRGITHIRRSWSGLDRFQKPTAFSSPPAAEPPPIKQRIEDTFSFDHLQGLHRLVSEVEQAIMVFGQNRRILSEIKATYKALLDSVDFGVHIKIALAENHILDFLEEVRNIEVDLENYTSRTQTLLHDLEKDENMFNAILQYKSMATGEYFATAAQKSALTMQRLTEDMHQVAVDTKRETVSMHAITILTLVFLPGTFVAVRPSGFDSVREFDDPVLTRDQTFFSSNIIDFEKGKGTGNIGDWTTNVSALKLFLAMCIPLMAVTLLSWLSSYLLIRRQRRTIESELPSITNEKEQSPEEV